MPMKQISLFSLLLSILMISGCSIFQSTQQQDIHISWKEPHKLYFQGKGAGAGMALMGTMGAMGMAIGVAIDEGISKDISKAQQKSGKGIEDILNEANASTSYHTIFSNQKTASSAPSIIIKRIEFNIVRGKNDATGVKIQALYSDASGKQRPLNYPKDMPKHKAPSFPLDQLKTNNKLANQLLLAGFKVLLSSIQDLNKTSLNLEKIPSDT